MRTLLVTLLAALVAQAPPDATNAIHGPAAIQGMEAATEAAFQKELKGIRTAMERRRWSEAYRRFQKLFEAHSHAAYVIDALPGIEPDLKRCAFWKTHDEPELEDLMDARVESWDHYRGRIRLVFDQERLGDLRRHESTMGTVFELPAVWSDTWTAEFSGPARVLGGNQLYVLLDDDTSYVVTLGAREKGTQVFYKHVVTLREGGATTTLDDAEPAEIDLDEDLTAKVTVTEGRIKLEVDRKRVFDVRRKDDGGFGRMAFASDETVLGSDDFGELEVYGEADTGFFDGLVDAAVQEARDAFEAAWDRAEHMPTWLAAAEAPAEIEDLPILGPFPVPETFDLHANHHPKTEHHVLQVETFLQSDRLTDAMRYLAELGGDEIEPTVSAFLACIVLMVSDRPREAFAVGERLWTGQPDSLTAGYLEAVLLAHLEQSEQAQARFQRLTESHPEAWEPWYGLTSLHLLERRVDDAVATLAKGQRQAEFTAHLLGLESRIAILTTGPAWDRVFERDAAHYHIRSDTDARTTRDVADEVEQAWRTYERVLGKVQMPKGKPVPLFLFSGAASYHAYAKSALSADMQHTAGLFSRDLQVVLVWNTPSKDDLLKTIRHEVLHQYLDARMGSIPSWFNEGLAEYYEIAELRRGLPVLGEPHAAHIAVLRTIREVPDLRELTRLSPPEFYASAETSYALAWALVHFLQHTNLARKRCFDALWERLDAGDDSVTALDRAFEDVDWKAWNEDFLEHLTSLIR